MTVNNSINFPCVNCSHLTAMKHTILSALLVAACVLAVASAYSVSPCQNGGSGCNCPAGITYCAESSVTTPLLRFAAFFFLLLLPFYAVVVVILHYSVRAISLFELVTTSAVQQILKLLSPQCTTQLTQRTSMFLVSVSVQGLQQQLLEQQHRWWSCPVSVSLIGTLFRNSLLVSCSLNRAPFLCSHCIDHWRHSDIDWAFPSVCHFSHSYCCPVGSEWLPETEDAQNLVQPFPSVCADSTCPSFANVQVCCCVNTLYSESTTCAFCVLCVELLAHLYICSSLMNLLFPFGLHCYFAVLNLPIFITFALPLCECPDV